jgi:hypothetical protein
LKGDYGPTLGGAGMLVATGQSCTDAHSPEGHETKKKKKKKRRKKKKKSKNL